MGSNTLKVREKKHNHLSCFGIGSSFSKPFLQSLVGQLVAAGVLRVNLEKFGAIQLTEKAASLTERHEVFLGRVDVYNMKKRKQSTQVKDSDLRGLDLSLYEALKVLRLRLANQKGVPAFVIFSDATLRQLATHKPMTKGDFLKISGVGKQKLDKYFQPFVQAIGGKLPPTNSQC